MWADQAAGGPPGFPLLSSAPPPQQSAGLATPRPLQHAAHGSSGSDQPSSTPHGSAAAEGPPSSQGQAAGIESRPGHSPQVSEAAWGALRASGVSQAAADGVQV